MTWQPNQPYNQLPPLPPKAELESIRTLKACIAARAALAALKQAGELLPNQSILINLLPLLEAKDSSEIENIVTTTGQLFQHAAEDSQGGSIFIGKDDDGSVDGVSKVKKLIRTHFQRSSSDHKGNSP